MSDIELIDSHCHLIFKNYEKDLDEVVLRFRSKGIKKLVHGGIRGAILRKGGRVIAEHRMSSCKEQSESNRGQDRGE